MREYLLIYKRNSLGLTQIQHFPHNFADRRSVLNTFATSLLLAKITNRYKLHKESLNATAKLIMLFRAVSLYL